MKYSNLLPYQDHSFFLRTKLIKFQLIKTGFKIPALQSPSSSKDYMVNFAQFQYIFQLLKVFLQIVQPKGFNFINSKYTGKRN